MIYIFNPVTLLIIYIIYTLTPVESIFYKPIMYIGAVIDLIVNLSYGTIIFMDLPKEWLLTKRVERLKKGIGYRANLANLICKLLNHFQPFHCI